MAHPEDSGNPSRSYATAKSPRDRSKKSDAVQPNDVPINAIDFSPAPSSSAGGGGSLELAAKDDRSARGRKSGMKRDETAKPSIQDARSQPIPDTVRERFIQIGNNFFFPDGAEAFTD